MGSFTSKSIIPATSGDNDLDLLGLDGVSDCESLLRLCSEHLKGLPEPIRRSWTAKKRRASTTNTRSDQQHQSNEQSDSFRKSRLSFEQSVNHGQESPAATEENIRILQWNALSQSKDPYHNFSLWYGHYQV